MFSARKVVAARVTSWFVSLFLTYSFSIYHLLKHCYSILPIFPISDKTSIVYSVNSLVGNSCFFLFLFFFFNKRFAFTLRWKPGSLCFKWELLKVFNGLLIFLTIVVLKKNIGGHIHKRLSRTVSVKLAIDITSENLDSPYISWSYVVVTAVLCSITASLCIK